VDRYRRPVAADAGADLAMWITYAAIYFLATGVFKNRRRMPPC
jgi:hypothetical protein